jgi:hypothetical protein
VFLANALLLYNCSAGARPGMGDTSEIVPVAFISLGQLAVQDIDRSKPPRHTSPALSRGNVRHSLLVFQKCSALHASARILALLISCRIRERSASSVFLTSRSVRLSCARNSKEASDRVPHVQEAHTLFRSAHTEFRDSKRLNLICWSHEIGKDIWGGYRTAASADQ